MSQVPQSPRAAGPGLAPVKKAKPDPRPARLGMAAGAVAALSVMAAGLVHAPAAEPVVAEDPTAEPVAAVPREVQVVRTVRYVQLKRGQTPPPGATVIAAAAPTPRVVVTRVVAAAAAPRTTSVRQTTRKPAARTRQSGRH